MPWQDLCLCLALLASTLLVYAPVRRFDFINYDDPDSVTKNFHVQQGLSGDTVRWALTSTEAANWFPITRVSHALDYQLFQLQSGAHHVVNVALHGCAALLLFLFLRRATRCRWPSAAVAFLFALQPLHVESVAWISERKDTLSALFWFLTLWLYIRYVETPSRSRYALVFLAFCADLMSKPMAVTLPIVLLLVDYWPLRRALEWRKLLTEKAPLFAVAIASATMTYFAQQHSGAVKALANFPLALRFENALVSYVVYIGQTFWPSNLAVFYPFPAEIPVWKPVTAAALIAGISAIIWSGRKTRAYLFTGWLWFLITLLPVIGIVQAGAQSHADRYMYLPMTGLLIMLAWGALEVVSWRPNSKVAALAMGGLACIGCAGAIRLQLSYWQNSGSLFEHALAVTDRNYVAEHNLGSYLLDVPGQLPSAISHLEKALEINPDSAQVHSDLGIAFAKSGRQKEAVHELETALQIDPTAEQARHNLAMAQASGQAADSAIAHYNRGVELLKSKSSTDQAISEFQTALRLNPDYAEAHNDLGVAYSGVPGHLQQAIDEFEAAVRLKPDYMDAQYNLGAALSQIPSRVPEAIAHFEMVERIHPDPGVEQILRQLRSSAK